MGFTRKLMSLSTAGLVDYRSDKERTAAYTRGIRKQSRKQTKLLKQQGQGYPGQSYPAVSSSMPGPPPGTQLPVAPTPPPPPAGPVAGWYPDQADSTIQRYFDGTAWTSHTAPLAPPPPPQ